MTNDVDTLATALYATTDDMLKEHPDQKFHRLLIQHSNDLTEHAYTG